jgi:hypothetical protein
MGAENLILDVPGTHCNGARVAAALALAGLVLVSGCDRLPQRVRVTPEISGRLLRGGRPVPDVRLAIARIDEGSTGASCDRARAGARSDGSGDFHVSALRDWMGRDDLARDVRTQGQFVICTREGEREWTPLLRAPQSRWDSVSVECDLGRAWLAADRDGVQGRCEILAAALDSQPLARQRTRSPGLTCDTTATRIEPLRLGPIRINGSVAELRRLCPTLRDTQVTEEGLIGATTEFASVLAVAGRDVLIYRTSGVIRRIVIEDPVFRTSDSIGVGTRVTRLLGKPDLHVVVSGASQGPYVFAWHGSECGIGYSFTRPTYAMRDRQGMRIPNERLRAWPASTAIRRVTLGFCPQREFPEVR